jgi:hypothetical protein
MRQEEWGAALSTPNPSGPSCPQGAGLPDRRAVPGAGEAAGPEGLYHRRRHGYGSGEGGALGMGAP